ncbi:MAG: tetratricopeptide repeat protein [Spirochaetia bacterium]|jgi:tetratricopeptide (TPR) repeat protein
MRNILWVILLSASVLLGCASVSRNNGREFEKAPLFGMMYDEENQPCVGVKLTVDGVRSENDTGLVTDIRGRFMLPALSRGEHVLGATKPGYEDLSVKIVFLNRTDVLFLRMTSFGQLLAKAEKALEEKKWNEAEALLARAEKLDAGDSVLRFLLAVRAYKTERYSEAVDILNSILAKGVKEPSLYLFLADIYQKDLGDQAKAIANLEAYLTRKANSDVEKRLAELKK